MIELRHLRYFLALSDELHFGRAAERLFVAQPALSNTIRQLEQEVGCALFRRTTRKVELTAAGRAFRQGAQRTLDDLENTITAARQAQRRLAGTLDLRIGVDVEPVCVPLLHEFKRSHPDVKVHAQLSHDAEALDTLEHRRADAIFMWGAPAHRRVHSALISRVPFMLALPATHRLARLKAIPLARLRDEPIVLFPREHGPIVFDAMLDQLTEPDGPPPPVIDTLEGPSGQREMVALVARGKGLCPVTSYLFEAAAPTHLVTRPVRPPMAIDIRLVWLDEPSEALRALILAVARSDDQSRPDSL